MGDVTLIGRWARPGGRMLLALLITCGALALVPATAEAESTCSTGAATTYTADVGPSSPRPALQAQPSIANYPGVQTRAFDVAGNDQYFAHSFEGLTTAGQNIIEAYLEVVLTTGGSNDAIHFGDLFNDARWGSHLIAGGFPMGVPTTKVYDLGALPASGTYPTNLVPAINNNGYFDVAVQDDSMVDRLVLTVCTKPISVRCERGLPTVFFAGHGPSSPRDDLQAQINTSYTGQKTRDFDETGPNKYFSHTFTSLVAPTHDIVQAFLEVRATNEGDNDNINLGRMTGPPGGSWGSPLATEGFPPSTPMTKLYDLGALNLLGVTNTFGELDVVIQDDSTVDYLELTVCTDRKPRPRPRPWPLPACYYYGPPFESTGFTDVDESTFYAAPVAWAKANSVTTGTSATTFAPASEVSRAQMAAFLWRMACEQSGSGPAAFGDVPGGLFYSGAVDWLRANAVTTGTSPTTFSPTDTVNRAQMAAFLWRMAGSPTGSPDSGFTDVPADAFYKAAVDWLKAQGITTGLTPTTFGPTVPVTRAQMATFLYRMALNPPSRDELPDLP